MTKRQQKYYPHLAKQYLSEAEIFTEIVNGTCTRDQFRWWVSTQKFDAIQGTKSGPKHGW